MIELILETWRDPMGAMRRILPRGWGEEATLILIILSIILPVFMLIGGIQEIPQPDGGEPIRIGVGFVLFGAVLAVVATYGFCWVIAMVCRAMGGKGTAAGTRLAYGWSNFAALPIALLGNLLTGMLAGTALGALVNIIVMVFSLRLIAGCIAAAQDITIMQALGAFLAASFGFLILGLLLVGGGALIPA